MERKEKLIIATEMYREYSERTESLVEQWYTREQLNSFETFLKNSIWKEEVLEAWYVQI